MTDINSPCALGNCPYTICGYWRALAKVREESTFRPYCEKQPLDDESIDSVINDLPQWKEEWVFSERRAASDWSRKASIAVIEFSISVSQMICLSLRIAGNRLAERASRLSTGLRTYFTKER